MVKQAGGFRELAHTADWELEVWASDLSSLFEQAARGMYALAGARLGAGPRLARSLELSAPDPETLLVSFLSELLYFSERDGLGFDQFELAMSADHLTARLEGSPLSALDKEIKAVTYHNLRISETPHGLEVRIVFDV